MLKLLLDEHISPEVAKVLRRRLLNLTVHAMSGWEGGSFLGVDDASCLKAAAEQGLTLVTYDRRTITPLLKTWMEQNFHHAGVIFVGEKTFGPNDIGGLARALEFLAKETRGKNWTDTVVFLHR